MFVTRKIYALQASLWMSISTSILAMDSRMPCKYSTSLFGRGCNLRTGNVVIKGRTRIFLSKNVIQIRSLFNLILSSMISSRKSFINWRSTCIYDIWLIHVDCLCRTEWVNELGLTLSHWLCSLFNLILSSMLSSRESREFSSFSLHLSLFPSIYSWVFHLFYQLSKRNCNL